MRKFTNQDVDFADLRSTLVNSKLARDNPPLFQVINRLIDGGQLLREKISNLGININLESQVSGILPPRFGGNNVRIYTPTLYLMANLSGAGVDDLYFQHTRDQVIVFGKFQVDPITNNQNTELGFDLPIKSYFDFEYQCAGSGYCPTEDQGCAIIADVTNKRGKVKFKAASNSVMDLFFTFGYKIIEQ